MYTKLFNRLFNNAGFSLVELLAGIAMIGMLATISLPNIKGYKNAYLKTQKVMRAEEHNLLIFEELRKSFAFSHSVLGLNTVKVHTGKIDTASSPSYVRSSLNNNPQHEGSSAISAAFIDPALGLEVISQSGNPNSLSLKTCLSKKQVSDYEKSSVWFLGSIDGVWEFFGKIYETSETCKQGKVYLLEAKIEGNSFFRRNNEINSVAMLKTGDYVPTFKVILPVVQSHTLYVDKNKTLRRIDHNLASSQPAMYESSIFTASILSKSECGEIVKVEILPKELNLSANIMNKEVFALGTAKDCELLNLIF